MMRGATWAGIALVVVLAVALADLVGNPKGTQVLAAAGVSGEKSALNAELGKTS
jgi:hypothetical protein